MSAPGESAKVRRLRVRLPAQTLDQVVSSFKSNLSSSGVFLRMKKDLQPKDAVTVEVLLADRTPLLSGEGVVAWVGEPSTEGLRGVSCEIAWDARSQAKVDEILARSTIPPPPALSEASTTEPDRYPIIDSLPAPAPTPRVGMGAEDETEADRMPTVKMQGGAAHDLSLGAQETTLEESAASPLDAGFLSPPIVPAGAGEPVDSVTDEDQTLESSAPDFAAWADKSGVGAAGSELSDTMDGETGQKSGVWRWLKKRFGSNA